jgi:phage terminase small subunit
MTIGSRAQVYHGNAEQTAGGLVKKDLKMVNGEIVSKTKSKSEKKNPWISAVAKARRELGIKKGSSFDEYIPKKGSELYKTAKKIYSK